MDSVKERLFNAAAMVSGALLVLLSALWLLSYFRTDALNLPVPSGTVGLWSSGGCMSLGLSIISPGEHFPVLWFTGTPEKGLNLWEFHWHHRNGPVGSGRTQRRLILLFPGWVLAAVFAPLPALWLWSRRRRGDGEPCPACGYDLRGTPSGPCPECGAERSLA
jgi:hypothetical protein